MNDEEQSRFLRFVFVICAGGLGALITVSSVDCASARERRASVCHAECAAMRDVHADQAQVFGACFASCDRLFGPVGTSTRSLR